MFPNTLTMAVGDSSSSAALGKPSGRRPPDIIRREVARHTVGPGHWARIRPLRCIEMVGAGCELATSALWALRGGKQLILVVSRCRGAELK